MNRLLFAAIAAFATVSSVSNVSAETEFEGSLCLTSANATCVANGWDAGTCYLTRYAPPNVGTNGPDTELSIFSRTFAMGFVLGSGTLIGNAYHEVSVNAVARGGYSVVSEMRFTSHKPAVPTTATEFITIRGNILNLDGIAGCTVGFSAAMTRRP